MVLFKSTALISVIQTLRYLHSTMVLFKSLSIKIFLFRSQFTFHYGPIQILFFPSLSSFLLHLHSTMVLFKLFTFVIVTTCAIIFTFHYGPIQIIFETIIIHNVPIFTFHYGPIQIATDDYNDGVSIIYIPLWSYSNTYLKHRHQLLITYLHSTMVLFKSVAIAIQ